MSHKYLVTGSTGKIGSLLVSSLNGEDYLGISRREKGESIINIDLSFWNPPFVNKFSEYDTVVHLAAKAHIDSCEEDRKLNKNSEAWKNNVEATKNVVEFCRQTKKKLIFLSTECVFDGTKAKYTERDIPSPLNWYGETKLESEKVVSSLSNSLILRTVMSYDGRSKYKDIVRDFASILEKREKLLAANDQTVSFTYTGDIVSAILISSERNLKGLYHFAGRDAVSIYELAVKIGKVIGINPNLIIPATMKEILGEKKAKLRLRNSVLDSSKFRKETGFVTVDLEEGLNRSLK